MHVIAIQSRKFLLAALYLVCGAGAGAATAAAPQSDRAVTVGVEAKRADILAIAKRYAEHAWKATDKNIHHGVDEHGVQVDTPDHGNRKAGFRTDTINVGIPYQWGGFSSIEEFERGLERGLWAGHLPKRGAGVSRQAVGVDCSGFVSRCWDLPRKHSTRSIGNICYVLDDFSELQPGDIMNTFDGHVVLFVRFADEERTRFEVYEAAGTRVQKSIYTLEKLQQRNYKPLRYKPLDPRWGTTTLAPPQFSFAASVRREFEPTGASTLEFAELPDLMRRAKAGDWVRYSIDNDEITTRSIARRSEDSATLHVELARGGAIQKNEIERSLNVSAAAALLEFAGMDQRFDALTVTESRITKGWFHAGGSSFRAQRIQATLQATLLSRGVDYPVTISVDAIQSDVLPLEGMLRARYDFKIHWSDTRTTGGGLGFELLDYHRG